MIWIIVEFPVESLGLLDVVPNHQPECMRRAMKNVFSPRSSADVCDDQHRPIFGSQMENKTL